MQKYLTERNTRKRTAMPIWDNTGYVIPSNCDLLLKYTAATKWDQFVKFSEEYLQSLFTTARLQGKIDQYSSLIDSVVRQDPVINYNSWLKNVSSLRSAITRFRTEYNDYVHGRNSNAADTSDYSTPFPGSGKLLITSTNNFEFITGPTTEYSKTSKSEGSIINLIHNSINPLWAQQTFRQISSLIESMTIRPIRSGPVSPCSLHQHQTLLSLRRLR